MAEIKPGDIVARRSYGKDILFKVKAVTITEQGKKTALLKGLDVRLSADAPVEDLELQPAEQILLYRHQDIHRCTAYFRRVRERQETRRAALWAWMDVAAGSEEGGRGALGEGEGFFELPGRVLHVDGDAEYLDRCLQAYQQLRLPATGFFVAEEEQAYKIPELLSRYTPDILVLTGHDGLTKRKADLSSLDSYRHSKYFVAAIKAARRLRPSHDDLVIFAGACQSHYEALLEAGATFASSPARILIHAFDPLLVVERVAYTPIRETVVPREIIKDTITGEGSIGGVEVKGKLRLGYPDSPRWRSFPAFAGETSQESFSFGEKPLK
ncbi:MAG: sporulation peptidase YabG [Thermanaeromonas sp.]|uniref:sporulation peptidase YabG n=1 Tax=Thermanaeromonas sp. TaxID=2003697 RepID=UPI00243B9605|nr:sporulation peptidase YabG [Thermanaeromonas sp.]MCG0277343.1 sporulation peptidase YabG [Thermanaeromonas sp.]